MNDMGYMNRVGTVSLLICLLFLLAFAVQAAPLEYDLSWWSADGGGGNSQAESYMLSGTIGQADAGTLHGGSYSLAGGFWSAAPSAPVVSKQLIFLPLVRK